MKNSIVNTERIEDTFTEIEADEPQAGFAWGDILVSAVILGVYAFLAGLVWAYFLARLP